MAEQRHGRYYAQELMMDQDANVRELIQDALDAGENQEWHLVGASDVVPGQGVILFWDTLLGQALAGPQDSSFSASRVKK
jgi:hypothetical protein